MKLKKIIMVSASLVLALGMSATAFAADIGNGVANSSDAQVKIPKGITFINEEAVSSFGPGITYSYTVAPANVAAGTTVTDSNNHSTTVNAGPTDGLTLVSNNITFSSSDKFTTSAAGVEATKDLALNVDISKFSKPGVYRYVLTDTTSKASLLAAGITRDDNYDTDRYIDVFIKRNPDGTFAISGYALKDEQASNAKDPGFVKDSAAESGNNGAAKTDRYKTYNLVLTKQVTGAMGDIEHSFPFVATITNDGKSFSAGKTGSIADTSSTSLSTVLKHGESYYIKGLSPKATIAYQETNDTTDLYTVTVAGKNGALTVNADDTAKTYDVAAADVSTYTSNSATSVAVLGASTTMSEVTYTNALEDVSPTGLAIRYGLFFFLLATAGLLIAVNRRSKEEA